ncbi:MAG: tRNA lysidine(34) synthetase TilS [Planctomycetota bacterium]
MTKAAAPALPARGELLLRASRHSLAATLARELDRRGLLAPDRPLVALASGGGDSTALLVLLAAVRDRRDALGSVHVLALDHGLRPDAAEEAAHALEVARHLGFGGAERVKCPIGPGNTLDRARAARIEQAFACCARVGARHVLLGHQADDRAESILIALARGGGADGLAGLAPARTLQAPDGAAVEFVRPLLAARREELRDFLRTVEVPWRDDPSNALRTRGSMRGEPAVAALLDRIAAASGDFGDELFALFALRDERLDALAPPGATEVPRTAIDALPEGLRPALLRRLVHAAGGECSRATLDAALRTFADADRAPHRFACARGIELEIDARGVRAVTR